jgi:hypothetical protein
VFPRLFHSRVPRYEAIARPHGYTVESTEVAAVRDEQDFLAWWSGHRAQGHRSADRSRRGRFGVR